jgi:hypothetical protein
MQVARHELFGALEVSDYKHNDMASSKFQPTDICPK